MAVRTGGRPARATRRMSLVGNDGVVVHTNLVAATQDAPQEPANEARPAKEAAPNALRRAPSVRRLRQVTNQILHYPGCEAGYISLIPVV